MPQNLAVSACRGPIQNLLSQENNKCSQFFQCKSKCTFINVLSKMLELLKMQQFGQKMLAAPHF
jgi:hypothetical protein